MLKMGISGKKGGPKEQDYNYVLTKYIKSLDQLKQDYQCEGEGINNNIFATDFSEIFLYMYHYRETARVDARLVNYIFRRELNRDFKFTLFPPAIFELRRHYDHLHKISKKYNYSKKPQASSEFKKILKEFGKLPKDKDIGDPSAKVYYNKYFSSL